MNIKNRFYWYVIFFDHFNKEPVQCIQYWKEILSSDVFQRLIKFIREASVLHRIIAGQVEAKTKVLIEDAEKEIKESGDGSNIAVI